MSIFRVDAFFRGNINTQASYVNPDGVSSLILVIKDETYSEIGAGDIRKANKHLTVTCRTEDVEDADNRATISMEGTTYNIMKVEPTGTGLTMLDLSAD